MMEGYWRFNNIFKIRAVTNDTKEEKKGEVLNFIFNY